MELRREQKPTPPEVARLAESLDMAAPQYWDLTAPDGQVYHLLMGREPLAGSRGDYRWHLSITGRDDVPPWRVMVAAAHLMRPGVPFVIGVPPRDQWLNLHEHCLHLWETKEQAMLDAWRAEGRGDTPT